MKKLIALVIICALIVGGIYYAKNKGYLDISKYLQGEEIKNEDILVNSLQSNNSVYYYTKLSDYQKSMYNKLLNGIAKLNQEITIDTNTDIDQEKISKEISDTLSYIFADHPEIWYVKPSYEIKVNSYLGINVVKVSMMYTVSSKSELDKEVKEVEERVNNILNKMIKSNMTDYEKALVIHDYLAENITYYKYNDIESIPDEKHSAYGSIIDKSAVCDGITKAYQIILNKLDIENIFVEGTTEGVPHAWNMIKLDEEYYHIDLTSSATIMGDTKTNMPVHVYFNVTDYDILETHTIEKREKLPIAKSTKYNYYKYEGKEITHMDNFDYMLKQIVNRNNNKQLIEIKITGVYNAAEKLVDELYNLDYNQIKTKRVNKVSYNKVLDVYILPKE